MKIEFKNVTKSIGKRNILNNVSFSFDEGNVLALLGPNGAGKTTTIRLLMGLISPNSGSIEAFGERIDSEKSKNWIRSVSSVQNDGALYDNLTVLDNLEIWADLYGLAKNQANQDIDRLLKKFDLERRSLDKVGQLSKGMRQKVLLIRSLLPRPKLLILDEPTSGLDPQMAEQLVKYLEEYIRESHTTVIMATHQLVGLENFADDILIIRDGKVVTFGKPEKLISERWPQKRLKIKAVDNQNAKDWLINSNFKDRVSEEGNSIYLNLQHGENSSNVIATLSKSIDLVQIGEETHSIKDYYFDTLEER